MNIFHEALSFSTEKKYEFLVRFLTDFKKQNFLQINPLDLQAFLSDPQQIETHSLVFLHILEHLPWAGLSPIFYQFLIKFDTQQILFAMRKFNEVVENYVKFCFEAGIAAKIIRPLFAAVTKLEGLGITPLHSLYLQLCLRTKMYKEGYRLASRPFGSIARKATVSQYDAHIYFYYCARIFIGLKLFDKAINSIEFCFNLYCQEYHEVLLEAKRLHLILLFRSMKKEENLRNKKIGFGSSFLNCLVESQCEILFSAVACENLNSYQAFLRNNEKALRNDKIMGLMKQASYSIPRRTLLELKRIYMNYHYGELKKLFNIQEDEAFFQFIFRVNEIKETVKINTCTKAVEFVRKGVQSYEKAILGPLSDNFLKLQVIREEYEKEYNKKLKEKLLNPELIMK